MDQQGVDGPGDERELGRAAAPRQPLQGADHDGGRECERVPVRQPDHAEPGLARLLLEDPSGVAAVVAEHPVPGSHQRRDGGDRDYHRAVGSEGTGRVTEGADRIGKVLDHIKNHDGPRHGELDRPGLLEIVDADVTEAQAPAILDGLGHQVEPAYVVPEVPEGQGIRPAPHSAFDQQARGRRMTTEELEHQLPLSDVPPVSLLDRNQVLEVARVHGTPFLTVAQTPWPGAWASLVAGTGPWRGRQGCSPSLIILSVVAVLLRGPIFLRSKPPISGYDPHKVQ